MADKTGIEWTATVNPDGSVTPGSTWNPVTGCSKVSPGCAHCYAEGVALRFWPTQYKRIFVPDDNAPHNKALGTFRDRQFTDVMCHEDRLEQPLRWKRPRRIFVNSMSDLFHEDVPDAFIDKVFAIMALAPQHTFQVLTKRAERMRDYIDGDRVVGGINGRSWRIREAGHAIAGGYRDGINYALPLPNVWLGVSVENQHFADERIPLLLQTPAAVRFISAEPLLGPVDLLRVPRQGLYHDFLTGEYQNGDIEKKSTPHIDWVIVGGESGPGARPFNVAWARSIVGQCRGAGVPVFVKQLGRDAMTALGGRFEFRDRKGGDPSEWPDDLRVREFPRVA